MKVSGFTFIKNAIQYDYPIEEAIRSILPLCDEVIVAVGNCTDGTRELVSSIAPDKIKIIDTIWDDSLREGGKVLAAETDKALQAISSDSDWAFYIQGDEVMHEQYIPTVRSAMERYKDEDRVDGLLFGYQHFYGSYDYVGISSNWYRHEIRVIKSGRKVYSYRDAQGFRKENNEKLTVAAIDAEIYHYGWVKEPEAMQRKQETFQKLWHADDQLEKYVVPKDAYDYTANMQELKRFSGTHPAVMAARIDRLNWDFEQDISFQQVRLKDRIKRWLKMIGIDTEYKNYRLY